MERRRGLVASPIQPRGQGSGQHLGDHVAKPGRTIACVEAKNQKSVNVGTEIGKKRLFFGLRLVTTRDGATTCDYVNDAQIN